MKKLLAGLVFLMMLVMVGCGDSGDSKSAAQKPKPTRRPTRPAATKPAENNDSTGVDKMESLDISLKDVYSKYGCKAGTCLTTAMISNPELEKLILSQFNSVTMENDMKPDYILSKDKSIEAGEVVVEFNQNMLKMLKWAKDNGMAVRGHTLVWYSQTPEWLFHEDFDLEKPFAGREVMLERMESFIKQVFEKLDEFGYLELFYAYDVVNEAWLENGQLREEKTYWKQTIGDDYLWYAFFYAKKYAPEYIDLYYNDYNEQFKGDALVKFVNQLVDENGNYLIDGIGLQAHMYTQDDLTKYIAVVDKLAETGLKLQITELDAGLGAWQHELPASEENFKKQGQFYYTLLSQYLERVESGKVKSDAITFWGFKDDMSWRRSASPVLFDAKLGAKPAFYGACLVKEKAGF